MFSLQITCRNRAIGKSFNCNLCSKSFPTKRHLHEHNKRKHPSSINQNNNNNKSNNNSPIRPEETSQDQSYQAQPLNQVQQQPSFSTYDSNYYTNYPTNDPYVKNELMHGHDLPLPNASTNFEDDHNVGSLLRLVYSCPDQLENSHSLQHQSSQNTVEYIQNTSSANAAQSQAAPVQTSRVCPDLMDYSAGPILDIPLDYL